MYEISGKKVHGDFNHAVPWQASQRPPLTLKLNVQPVTRERLRGSGK